MFFYYGKNSQTTITELEVALNFTFSKTYKDFLLNYGGVFVESWAVFTVDFLDTNVVDILKIFNPMDLLKYNHEYLEEISDYLDCIIIATDPGGNFFLLDKLGKIYCWDRTLLHDCDENCESKVPLPYEIDTDISNEEAIYLLFDDFEEFFRIIQQASQEQNSPITLKKWTLT